MRLVVTRYEKDRATLSCNYANGAAGGSRCTDGGGGASAGGIGARRGAPPSSTPASTPEIGPVPDLGEILALPQDEMRDIVARFLAGAGRGTRGPRGGGSPTAEPDAAFFTAWLAALKTLDFDALSRNAQVDYLAIRYRAEAGLSRVGSVLPAGPPRKPDNLELRGTPRGREGLIRDLQDAMIVYTPEQLIRLANEDFAWCEAEMRRSFESPQYANQPLYQAAYLLGGLQLRGLRKDLVDGGVMTNRQFHDEIMRQGNMPIALLRLAVSKVRLSRHMDVNYRFAGELPAK
jgi:hypothetical protein